MKLINSFLAAALLLPIITLTSCNDSGNDDPLIIYNAFVTYDGSEGNTATFTTQEKDDSDIITFTATVNASGLTKGKRYVISYHPRRQPIQIRPHRTVSGAHPLSGAIQGSHS